MPKPKPAPETLPKMRKLGRVGPAETPAARDDTPPPLRLVRAAKTAKSTSRPPRRTRTTGRKHVTPDEFTAIRKSARARGRYPLRDALLVTLMYRHGLRVSEAVCLTWDDVDLGRGGEIRIARKKGGRSGVHVLDTDELRMLAQWKKEQALSRFIFATERGGPMTERTARNIVTTAAREAGVPIQNPHALRHGAGYRLVRRGVDLRRVQEFLGHKDIKSTTVYTALDPSAVRGLEKD